MNARDQLVEQLQAEMVRVHAIAATAPAPHNYKLKVAQVDRDQAIARAENALALLDSTAMQRALETLRGLK
jgi:hypothetical protein